MVSCGAYADLFDYVSRPDAAFSWKLRDSEEQAQGKVYDLHMVSQVWQGITWEHQVQVYEPKVLEFPDVMGLLITGGSAGKESALLGLTVANMTGMRLAALYHIPNQPLFDNLREDALISYTWVKYLETGEEDWILLFPMVKSAIRAMDCLEALAEQEWKTKLRGFVVTGASKRGWTTYLTAIYDPQRVIGIAPMVFDILNMATQAYHQKEFWGDFSEQIRDYTEKGLEKMAEEGRGFRLFWMVDPYSYRDRLLMPKFIILGSNDAYWPTDAVNLYWHGLSFPKLLLIAPNSGHGLEDRARVLSSLCAFVRLVASGSKLPGVRWDWTETRDGVEMTLSADREAVEGRLWVARSDVRDFRKARWEEQPLGAVGDGFVGKVERAQGQYTAAYGELVFDVEGRKLYTSTQPRVLHPK
jgi:PhoPQ-activated pathogenicity-related protein